MERAGSDVDAVAGAVLRYIALHPRACDSLLGIERWWLPEEGICCPAAILVLALEALVARGRLVARTLADGTVIYSAPRNDGPRG